MKFNIGNLEDRLRAVKERYLEILKNKFPNELFTNLEALMYEDPEEFEHYLDVLEWKVFMGKKPFTPEIEFNSSNFFKSYPKIEKALDSYAKELKKTISEKMKRADARTKSIKKALKIKKFNPKTSSDYSKKPSKNPVYKKKKSDQPFIQLEKTSENLEYRFKIVKGKCLRLLRKYFPKMLFEYLEKMMYEDPEEFEYYFKILEKGILSIRHEVIGGGYIHYPYLAYWDIATDYGDYLRNRRDDLPKYYIKKASARAKQVDSWCRRILSKSDNELRKWINNSDKKSSSSQIQGTQMIQKLVKRIRRVRKRLRWYF